MKVISVLMKVLKNMAAMWILKTRECHKLSRSTIENILEDVTLLFHSVHEEMYDYNMMKKLS